MVWAWMLWSPCALGTRTESWLRNGCSSDRMLLEHDRNHDLGHGCSGHCMLLAHDRNYGLGMNALVTVCSCNPNGIMVWATRRGSWFGHGCSCHRMLSENDRNYGLGMGALVTVCSWNTNLEHERNHGLGMDALVTVCSWNTNGIMVWAWMLWSPYALGTRAESWLGHGCSGHRMLLEHDRNYGLSMDALVIVCTALWFERSPNLKVLKPSICSLASKMVAWSTPQMTSKPLNPLKNLETHSFFYLYQLASF